MLTLDVAGTPAYLEPDAVVVAPDGTWTVVEIKSFPMIDGSADAAKVGAAARQSAVYVLALEEVAARMATGGSGPSGSDPSGSAARGSAAHGSAVHGPAADPSAADGSTADGPTPDESAMHGSAADGSSAHGPATHGSAADGPAPDGTVPDGPTPDGSTAHGPATHGPAADGPAPDGTVPDGPTADGSTTLGADTGGSAAHGPATHGSAADGPTPDGTVADGPTPGGVTAGGGRVGGVRQQVLLVCPKDFSNLPAASAVDVRKQRAVTRRQLSRLTRVDDIAATLPPGLTFDVNRPADELSAAVDAVPATYAPECLAACELAFHCRERARARGELTSLGRALRADLGSLATVEETLAAARGEAGDPDDPAVSALRRAGALRAEALAGGVR
nr:hypothetical protein [Streptomyces typhae]